MADETDAVAKCIGCRFFCAVCRILCYTCVRRCCPCCFGPGPREREEVAILVLGLQSAGKTTLLATLAGEPRENDDAVPQPTMGFAFKAVNIEDWLTLNFQELGGSEQIRFYWDKYYTCKNLIVFVVDGSSSDKELAEARGVLRQCLTSPSLSALPLLLVCSKHDSTSTRTATQMRESLAVEEIERERRVLVVTSSYKEQQATRDRVTNAILQLLDTHKPLKHN